MIGRMAGSGPSARPSWSLPVDLYSPDQLSAVILELRNLIGKQRDAALRSAAYHSSPEPTSTTALLAGVLHNAKVSAHDLDASQYLLERLQVTRNTSPLAHITLADLPNRPLKRQLTEWFRSRIHPSALLTFAVRADIGGGMVLQTGSRLYDFSFRKQIMARRARIGELFEERFPVRLVTPAANSPMAQNPAVNASPVDNPAARNGAPPHV